MMDASADQRSIGTLVSDLARETSDLVRKEAALAKAEISETAAQIGMALAVTAAGALLALAGLVVLLDALVFAIAEVLPPSLSPWLAALIVGVVAVGVGFILVFKGKSELQPKELAPRRTVESLQKDKAMLKEQVR